MAEPTRPLPNFEESDTAPFWEGTRLFSTLGAIALVAWVAISRGTMQVGGARSTVTALFVKATTRSFANTSLTWLLGLIWMKDHGCCPTSLASRIHRARCTVACRFGSNGNHTATTPSHFFDRYRIKLAQRISNAVAKRPGRFRLGRRPATEAIGSRSYLR